MSVHEVHFIDGTSALFMDMVRCDEYSYTGLESERGKECIISLFGVKYIRKLENIG